jgi:RTX calcium-binding nonapeptide repeat (4 copies)
MNGFISMKGTESKMQIGIRKHKRVIVSAVAATAVLAVAAAGSVHAALQEGGAKRDVIFGADDDNAGNTAVQPDGVDAKQHLDNTDVLLGSTQGDLLVGLLGDDVADGQSGTDILVGGPEAGEQPNSDVLMGEAGNDFNIWAPGDGSDAFVGGSQRDTQILAPFVLNDDGSLDLERFRGTGRRIPRVSIDDKPQFSCTIESADGALAGYDYLVRFFANGNLAVTIRLADVERVLCPSPNAGMVQIAQLSDSTEFVERAIADFDGTLLGAIIDG